MVEASHIVARVWEIRCVRQVTDGASWIRRHADQVTLSHRRAGCFWTAAQPAVRVLSKLSKSSSQTRAGRHKRRILLSQRPIHSHMGRIQKVKKDFLFQKSVLSHSRPQYRAIDRCHRMYRMHAKKEKRKRGAAGGIDPRKRLDGCYQRTIKTQSCCNNLPRLPQKASPLT